MTTCVGLTSENQSGHHLGFLGILFMIKPAKAAVAARRMASFKSTVAALMCHATPSFTSHVKRRIAHRP
jgi:hypothetical protein